jgi:hypothetical protein
MFFRDGRKRNARRTALTGFAVENQYTAVTLDNIE